MTEKFVCEFTDQRDIMMKMGMWRVEAAKPMVIKNCLFSSRDKDMQDFLNL